MATREELDNKVDAEIVELLTDEDMMTIHRDVMGKCIDDFYSEMRESESKEAAQPTPIAEESGSTPYDGLLVLCYIGLGVSAIGLIASVFSGSPT